MISNVRLAAVQGVADNRWLRLAFLTALIAIACTSGNDAAPTPTNTAVPEDGPMRWGFNPHLGTGQHDPPALLSPLPENYRLESVLTGLDRPTQMAVTPDGRIFVAEQPGVVRTIENEQILQEPFVSVDVYLPALDGTVELGLTGLVVDPAFDENGYVYLYYAADQPRRTVIARVRDEGGRGGEVEQIFSWEADPKCCHIGGGMRFAADGTLLIGVGEHEQVREAQRPLTPPGSILRINSDGTWPDDNPFIGPVYAYGLRNPYDIAIDPATGRIFAGENGFFGQDAVLEIKAGANYGWPGFDFPDGAEIEEPLLFFHNSLGMAGMEFYSSDVLSELTGRLYFCQYNYGGALHEIEFNDDGSVRRQSIRAPGCTSDVITGPEGFLYFLNYVEGTLYRIALAE